jgi:5-methylcytosine-specific restriction endonuclease McrA
MKGVIIMADNNQYASLLRALNQTQYTEQQKVAVWNKGRIVQGYDPRYVRADACGAFIEWNHYGNTASRYGWEIDHVIPVALGGASVLANLQPLQWQNNRAKGDSLALNYCVVRSY